MAGLTDKVLLREVGEALKVMIVERVRGEGKGVSSPGVPTSKLAPLSPKYIAERAKDKNLHPDTTPSTSNLTRTGQMLDALVVRVSDNKVSVTIPGGKALQKAIWTNVFRPWVNISAGEATRLRALILKLAKDKR